MTLPRFKTILYTSITVSFHFAKPFIFFSLTYPLYFSNKKLTEFPHFSAASVNAIFFSFPLPERTSSVKIPTMKTLLILLLTILLLLLALSVLFVFLIAPAHVNAELRRQFTGCRFAHRGLHSKDKSVPENSLAAFRLAVENGYGIELDIRFTKDKQLVVFHDDTLLRMCGTDRRVDEFTYEELQTFRLLDSTEQIPLFSEVLSLVNGQIPLLVELKAGPENALLCSHAYNMLQQYHGPYCIESFHPMIVHWFKKNAPQILRGQLSAPSHTFEGTLSRVTAFLLSHLLTNFLARPHFIAYHKGKAPFPVRLCQKLGALRAVWTLRDEDYTNESIVQSDCNNSLVEPKHTPIALFGENDMIIFEYFRP